MSAWMTTDDHISAIVQLACIEGIITFHMADDIGTQMKHENELSLAARYGDEVTPINDLEFKFNPVEAPLEEMIVMAACQSWMYQTCEYAGCDTAPGWTVVRQLVDHLVKEFGLNPEHPMRGITEAHSTTGWSLNNIEQAIKQERGTPQ